MDGFIFVKNEYRIKMEVVYRTFGLSGGSWKSCMFTKQGSHVNYTESQYKKLGGVSDLIKFDAPTINSIINNSNDTRFLTDVQEDNLKHLFNSFSDDIVMDLHTGYRPQVSDYDSNLWSLSSYLCDHGLYDFELTKTPEPPYKIYTDASYWPDLERGSIGFVVTGSNKGVYAVGCPIIKPLIPDNNIAEFYAALAAFKSLESESEVQIITDSTNLASILRREYEDYSSDTTDFLVEVSEKFDSLTVNTESRKQVVISDLLAEIGKNNPIVFGSEPRIS